MRLFWLGGVALSATLGLLSPGPAEAWDRGDVHNFATIPTFAPSGPGAACPNEANTCSSDVEGVAVGPDGTVYSASYGYNKDGALGGYGELFVFAPNGQLLTHFPVVGSSPHLIGLEYQKSSKRVLIADLGKGVVWKVDPETQKTSMFMRAPTIIAGKSPGLNALTFDKSGNVYVSDSFQGVVWRTGPSGGTPTAWYAPTNRSQNDLLLPDPNKGEILSPPFGANGIEFNNGGTALFALNTAYNSIVKIPVKTDGSAGAGVTFTTGLNGPDGLAVDANDNLWVAANQGDEIVVVDPSGRVVAKKGDFNGVAGDGSIQGLLFPASLEFSPDKSRLYITNLPEAQARVLYAVQEPFHKALLAGKTTHAAWREKPSFYAVSTEDRTINPGLERFMAKRMGAKTIEVKASHLSLISHPDKITALILEAAGQQT